MREWLLLADCSLTHAISGATKQNCAIGADGLDCGGGVKRGQIGRNLRTLLPTYKVQAVAHHMRQTQLHLGARIHGNL